jgi:hypothetical protein
MPGRFEEWLDGIDAVATTIYVVLIAVVVGAVCGVMFYIVRHWQPSWGTQGEGFYLAVAFLLVIGWAMGQLAWLIRRRRRSAWTFEDGSEMPLPKIDITAKGIRATWGAGEGVRGPASPKPRTWSFSFDRSPVRTFKVDASALAKARAARAAGRSWTEVCREINPEWDRLGTLDRTLYERAIEAAVRDATPNTP